MPQKEDRESERSGSESFRSDRRNFLKAFGTGAAVSALPLASVAAAEARSSAAPGAKGLDAPADARSNKAPNQTYRFLNSDEGDFIEAAVDTLISTDSTGPGALELGVANFIDEQLSGGYGQGEHLYLQGPFPGGGTPSQGYQIPMTPSQLLRAGMHDVQAYCMRKFGKYFSQLSPRDRAMVLSGLEHDDVTLDTVPGGTFFKELLQLTVQGYFADPMYGGNRGAAAWKMIGFPGPNAMYAGKIVRYRNQPYLSQPKGIEELI